MGILDSGLEKQYSKARGWAFGGTPRSWPVARNSKKRQSVVTLLLRGPFLRVPSNEGEFALGASYGDAQRFISSGSILRDIALNDDAAGFGGRRNHIGRSSIQL